MRTMAKDVASVASFWLAGISDWRKGSKIEEKDLRATEIRRGTKIEQERHESEKLREWGDGEKKI